MADAAQTNLSIEERFAHLEKEFSDLREEVVGLRSQTKDWRRTVGMIPDDETSRGAARLGREWRQGASEEDIFLATIDTKAALDSITNLAKTTVSGYSQQAIQDGTALLTSSAETLQLFADQIAAGTVDEDDLPDLKLNIEALAKMGALSATAIGKDQLANYTNSVIDILLKAVVKAVV